MGFKEGNEDGKATRFKPGQSGNPDGMPKGYKTFRTLIKEAAETEIDYKDLKNNKIKTTAGAGLVLSLLGRALYKNDTQAAKILIEHADGKQLSLDGEIKTTVKVIDLSGKDE